MPHSGSVLKQLILREDRYSGADDPAQIAAFDQQMSEYYPWLFAVARHGNALRRLNRRASRDDTSSCADDR